MLRYPRYLRSASYHHLEDTTLTLHHCGSHDFLILLPQVHGPLEAGGFGYSLFTMLCWASTGWRRLLFVRTADC